MTLGWDYGLKLRKPKEKKAKLDRAGKNPLQLANKDDA